MSENVELDYDLGLKEGYKAAIENVLEQLQELWGDEDLEVELEMWLKKEMKSE